MRKLLIAIVVLVALTANSSGLLMLTNPDGKLLGLPLALLEGSPFPDYFFPGILLVVVVGFSSLMALYFLTLKHRNQYNWGLLAGVLLTGWIVVQVLLIHSLHWLHVVYLLLGIAVSLVSLQLKGRWLS